MSFHTTLSLSISSYFAKDFIRTAALFTKKAYDIEQINNDQVTSEQKDEHRSFVLSSIVFSNTFLEALINELATDYSNNIYSHYGKLKNGSHEQIGDYWSDGIEEKPMLCKYQDILEIAGKDQFKTGMKPYQDVNYLRRLRNDIIHFKPEPREVANTNPAKQVNPNYS